MPVSMTAIRRNNIARHDADETNPTENNNTRLNNAMITQRTLPNVTLLFTTPIQNNNDAIRIMPLGMTPGHQQHSTT